MPASCQSCSYTHVLLWGVILRCTSCWDTLTKRVNTTTADTSSYFLGLLLCTEGQNIYYHILDSGDSILWETASLLADIEEVSERVLSGGGGQYKSSMDQVAIFPRSGRCVNVICASCLAQWLPVYSCNFNNPSRMFWANRQQVEK